MCRCPLPVLAAALLLWVLPAAAQTPPATFSYPNGREWAGARQHAATLSVAGDTVTGTFDTGNLCDIGQGLLLGGGGSITATLRGPWEGRGRFVFGSWSGEERRCSTAGSLTSQPASGGVCLFMGPDVGRQLAVIHRVLGPAGAAFVDYSLPAHGGPPTAVGLSPVAAGAQPVAFAYENGRAAADPRGFRMALNVQGDRVFGTMEVETVCSANLFLPGGGVTFEGTLSGPWEDPATTIAGFWGSDNRYCDGSSHPDFGAFTMSVSPGGAGVGAVTVVLAGLQGLPNAYTVPALGTAAPFISGPDPFFGAAMLACDLPLPPGAIPVAINPPGPNPPGPNPPGPNPPGPAGGGALARSVVLLLDASGSMADEGRMEDAKAAARRVLNQMTGDTEVALIVFYDCGQIELAQPFTTDPARISAALEPVQPANGTPLAAGIDYAQDYLRTQARGRLPRLVVLTDGEDSCAGDLMQAVRD